jgi:hypothetical protein
MTDAGLSSEDAAGRGGVTLRLLWPQRQRADISSVRTYVFIRGLLYA